MSVYLQFILYEIKTQIKIFEYRKINDLLL